MELNKHEIGARLKEFRLKNNLTLKDVASLCDTSAGYISDIERGVSKISLEILITLYRNFSIDVIWVLTGVTQEITVDDNSEIKKLKSEIATLKEVIVDISISKTIKKRDAVGAVKHKDSLATTPK